MSELASADAAVAEAVSENQSAAVPAEQPSGDTSVKEQVANEEQAKGVAEEASPSSLFTASEDSEQDAQTEQKAEVPEEYDFTDVTPDNGATPSESDIQLMTRIGHELGLSNEQARTLLQKGGSIFSEIYGGQIEAEKVRNFNALKADPELGGANFKTTRMNLSRAISQYAGGTEGEAYKLLESTGILYHPAILRMFNQIGAAVSEEHKFVGNASNRAPRKQNPYRSLYNNSPDMNFGD